MLAGKQGDSEKQQRRSFLAYVELVVSCVVLVGVFVFHSGVRLNAILAGYIGVGYVCLLAFAGTQIRKSKEEKPVGSALFPNLITALNILGIALIVLTGRADFFWSVTLWGWFISILFAIKRNRESNALALEELRKEHKILLRAVVAVTIFVCVAPMGSSPYWRAGGGAPVPAYAVLADSLLGGKLSIGFPIDPKLLAMENPYDPLERMRIGVSYFHDFVFYGGKYYVYFGAVPALLLFLPYQWLTGLPLATYHSTQIFAAFAVALIFALFFLLCKGFFKKLPFSLYLAASVVFSLVSVSFAIMHGNQYSTAVVSGVCFEVWSLYFFVRAGWHGASARSRMRNLFWGSLCGALVFGCRPPIGLANIALIPVLSRLWPLVSESYWKRGARFALALSPYLVIGVALMFYNYARFGNPLDFGVKYNMTHLDSTAYKIDFASSVNMFAKYLFALPGLTHQLHQSEKEAMVTHSFGGAFLNYPVLLFVFLFLSRSVRMFLRRHGIYMFASALFTAAFIIMVVDICAAPWWVHERNRLDFYFLLGIASFMAIGAYYEASTDVLKGHLAKFFPYIGLLTVVMMMLLLLAPFEYNITYIYQDFNASLVKILLFRNGTP